MNKAPKTEQSTSIKLLNRGMSKEEVDKLLTAPMKDRDRAFYKAVYDTFYRAQELLKCNIEDYNRETGELTALHVKNKYHPRSKTFVKEEPKHSYLSKSTMLLFKSIISTRKKGAIFVNNRGVRCSITYFQMIINDIATKIGIQKVAEVTKTGKEYHLVTIKALREAGERHMDMAGADAQITARASQHSALVKEKHYKKSSWEEFHEQQKKYHPAFQD